MTTQGVLFVLGIVFLVAAAACAGGAAWLFVKRDIRGIHDDLTGKKRAKTIAEMEEMTPANRRKQQRAGAPNSAAAAAAAAVAKNAAHALDMEDVQVTAAPKPKHAGTGNAAEDDSAANAKTAPESEAAATVVGGNEETIVGIDNAGEDTTTVDGLEDGRPRADGSSQVAGLASYEAVRRIVLADSADFVRIGRQGEVDA